jgi:cytochrome c-type protein NapC
VTARQEDRFMTDSPTARPGPQSLFGRIKAFVFTKRFAALLAAFVLGILFWGGFNTALDVTSTEEFCVGCHQNLYREYRATVHYQNRTGVRATCPDCHEPKDWKHRVVAKIQASNQVLHHLLGSIDTPEKFEAKRAQLASIEWARMKGVDSRECRNCHGFQYMDFATQGARGSRQHQQAEDKGMTCIDCHKGIAHTLPPIEQHIGVPKADPADLGKPEMAQ